MCSVLLGRRATNAIDRFLEFDTFGNGAAALLLVGVQGEQDSDQENEQRNDYPGSIVVDEPGEDRLEVLGDGPADEVSDGDAQAPTGEDQLRSTCLVAVVCPHTGCESDDRVSQDGRGSFHATIIRRRGSSGGKP